MGLAQAHPNNITKISGWAETWLTFIHSDGLLNLVFSETAISIDTITICCKLNVRRHFVTLLRNRAHVMLVVANRHRKRFRLELVE